MPKHRPRKPIQNICIKCGVPFICYSAKAIRCEKCRKSVNYASECYKKPQKAFKISRGFPPRKSIRQVLRELKRYNEENNTCLSYGQYISMIEKGEY